MKSVGIAELKAKLSAFLKEVEAGETLTVLDRRRPIAKVVPHSEDGSGLKLRPRRAASLSLHEVPLPPPLLLSIDAAQLLIDERHSER